MNLCTLSGIIGQDPKINTVSEVLVANFSLAVKHDFKKDDKGNYLTLWFKCNAWNKTAEFCEKHLKKGCKVLVQGEIQAPDSYETDYGTRINSNIRVNKLEMITWPDDDKTKKQEDDDVPF